MLRRTLTITIVLALAAAVTVAGQGFAVGAEPASYTNTFLSKYKQWNRNVVRAVNNHDQATRVAQIRLTKRVVQYTDRHLTWLERTQPNKACAIRAEHRYYKAVLAFRNKLSRAHWALRQWRPNVALRAIKAALPKQAAAYRAAKSVINC